MVQRERLFEPRGKGSEGEALRTSRGRGGKRFEEPREPPGRAYSHGRPGATRCRSVIRTLREKPKIIYPILSTYK